jgi:hypothetical protein
MDFDGFDFRAEDGMVLLHMTTAICPMSEDRQCSECWVKPAPKI